MSAAELTALAEDRHPWDWYVDESWCTEALIATLGLGAFAGQHIHDPCCGRGTIPEVFDLFGFEVSGGDVEDRRGSFEFAVGDWPFAIRDFFRENPEGFAEPTSIVFNPPYSTQNGCIVTGLTSMMVAKALRMVSDKVCVLVPLKWLSSDQRYRLFQRKMPSDILILMERPSMPPGHLIPSMGENAFTSGKADYCWVVFDNRVVTQPGDTRTHFVKPRDAAFKQAERGR
ncbi:MULTISPECIES: hypothetical protein [unclassified Sphingopyxis]|uniref:hypothetical protein n=1 Tax=unclassified Sphingopyxis TaxID=2614943 RepID=UPI0007316890|nr:MULTISPECIES: hypothetical protein [unclassified Sphingopyxis]KTE24428.1 hypothetical protein ATE61_13560 [Sphingopyxis sp. H057]KTE50956.1 hypothetical protein ATE69_17260 [Sphingopyxis sp. H071]KTE52099.1 hypothetical protein ATE64_11865 [Sphingopyxis sp. H073]KTE60568.1 hypothetical protein ATE66_08280 [Sphingopyxis sp. H107]KTE63843.1 hypothetical protein ATE65_13655 [Sphingopyxis sp. H100]